MKEREKDCTYSVSFEICQSYVPVIWNERCMHNSCFRGVWTTLKIKNNISGKLQTILFTVKCFYWNLNEFSQVFFSWKEVGGHAVRDSECGPQNFNIKEIPYIPVVLPSSLRLSWGGNECSKEGKNISTLLEFLGIQRHIVWKAKKGMRHISVKKISET